MSRLTPKPSKALLGGAAFVITALAAAPALADDVSGSVMFYGIGTFAKLHGLSLGISNDAVEPDPLKGKQLRLEGNGAMGGIGMQIAITGRQIRGGLDLSVYGVGGTRLESNSLSHGFYVKPGEAWGGGLDVFVGYELLKGRVRPYLDLVGSFNGVSLEVDLMHPEYGRLGRSSYGGWLFGFGPRAGLNIGFGKNGFFDLSGTYSLVGMERVRIVGGIGFRVE